MYNTKIFIIAILAKILRFSKSQKKRFENRNSTFNIQNLEDTHSSISTKEVNINFDNYTNNLDKASVDNDKILTAQGKNVYQLEENSVIQKYEAYIHDTNKFLP